jgi:hypothetical protein
VADHVPDPRWGAHAARIMDGSMWRQPPGGGHDDKAHPPIHPTRLAGPQVRPWPLALCPLAPTLPTQPPSWVAQQL